MKRQSSKKHCRVSCRSGREDIGESDWMKIKNRPSKNQAKRMTFTVWAYGLLKIQFRNGKNPITIHIEEKHPDS